MTNAKVHGKKADTRGFEQHPWNPRENIDVLLFVIRHSDFLSH